MHTNRTNPREVRLELTTEELLRLSDAGRLTVVTPDRVAVHLSVRDAVFVDASGEFDPVMSL